MRVLKQMNIVTKVSDLLWIGTITFVPLALNRVHSFSDLFLIWMTILFFFHVKQMNMVKWFALDRANNLCPSHVNWTRFQVLGIFFRLMSLSKANLFNWQFYPVDVSGSKIMVPIKGKSLKLYILLLRKIIYTVDVLLV